MQKVTVRTTIGEAEVQYEAPVTAEGVKALEFGYAGANSVDLTDAIAMEVVGANGENVYLTKESAEYLFWSLGTALGKDMDAVAEAVKAADEAAATAYGKAV
jgi:hypothetical protein